MRKGFGAEILKLFTYRVGKQSQSKEKKYWIKLRNVNRGDFTYLCVKGPENCQADELKYERNES